MRMSVQLSDYDYPLPEVLIAKRPLSERDASRMMVLHRASQTIEHRKFRDLPAFIRSGDLVVLNDTRVLTARRFSDDGAVELLFLENVGHSRWKVLVKPGRKMRVGATTQIAGVGVRVEEILANGERIVELVKNIDVYAGGAMPLPPYLRRASDDEDENRYQTVFAETGGAVAAPTAGLHFTGEMLNQLPHTFVTLHVGPGTFRPIQSENVSGHRIHAEKFTISGEAAEKINRAGRILAVGTTTVRTLETAASKLDRLNRSSSGGCEIVEQAGETDIFIYPPYEFRIVDVLLTNFHLPKSTLLMLVSAFAGREFVLRAYSEAIREQYRFYSYGDCMLIL